MLAAGFGRRELRRAWRGPASGRARGERLGARGSRKAVGRLIGRSCKARCLDEVRRMVRKELQAGLTILRKRASRKRQPINLPVSDQLSPAILIARLGVVTAASAGLGDATCKRLTGLCGCQRRGEITGLPGSTIYERIAQGKFPKPVKLEGRAVGWIESEVAAWQAERNAERKAQRDGGASSVNRRGKEALAGAGGRA